MGKALKIGLISLGALVLVAIGLVATGSVRDILIWYGKPSYGWMPEKNAPAPDYTDRANWAALPFTDDLADYAPAGFEAAADPAVDVFFIHPTGFLKGSNWNSVMDPDSQTEENTRWMMVNQASAYNGCCAVYAPRYREASIFRYLTASPDIVEKSMDLAYSDVVRAFDHFLEHNQGRPFILASHSQGTQHGFRLLAERIDGTPLEARMVAAFLIGSRVTNSMADTLTSVPVCDSDLQTGCLVHYAVFGEGGAPDDTMQDLVCVNPLNWRRDGARADAALHKGLVPGSGEFSLKFWGDDSAQGIEFGPLEGPVEGLTWAECGDGILYVRDLAGTPYAGPDLGGKNYHGLDYPLFHMDIRENAIARAAAFLSAGAQAN